MTTNPPPIHHAGTDRPAPPTVREIAALTGRQRDLSVPGAGADPAARAEFLADRHAVLARVTAPEPSARGPEVVGLVCAECGDDAVESSAPVEPGRPSYVHPDGGPLCTAPGDHRPAPPVEVVDEPDPEVRAANDAVAQALAGLGPPTDDDARAEQLIRWHHDTRDTHHQSDTHGCAAGSP